MPVSNDDLLKSINILSKVLTDIQHQSQSIAPKTLTTLEHVDGMLKRAAKDTGIAPETVNKLLSKFIKSTSGIGDQSKLVHALDEFNKKSPNYERLSRLITADEFKSFVDKSIEKIRVTPLKLNTKENLSLISKSIARGNKDYASSGFGKISNDFYKKATKDQLVELKLLRKSISNGEMLSNLNTKGLLRGLMTGAMAQVDDVFLNNAGFGELPGKMATLLQTIDNLRSERKKEIGTLDEERNSALVANNRLLEASYAEQKRVTKDSKDRVVEIKLQKGALEESLRDGFSDVLSKTSLNGEDKKKLENKLDRGTLSIRDINKITKDWENTLGDQITPQDKKDISEFKKNILSDITTMKQIGMDVDIATQVYSENLDRENAALVSATKGRAEVDKLILAEFKGQQAELTKRLSSKVYKNTSREEVKLIKNQLELEVISNIREKYGVSESEDRGLFADHGKRVGEILSEKGMSQGQIETELNSGSELAKAVSYSKEFQKSLEKLSDIFKDNSIDRRVPMQAQASIKTKKSSSSSTPRLNAIPNVDIESISTLPDEAVKLPNVRSSAVSSDIRSESSSNRQDAFDGMRESAKKSDDSHKLLEKIFGKNGEKSINVNVVNWPTPQNSNANTSTIRTSPPSSD